MGSRSRDQDDRIGGDEPVSDGFVDESAAAVLGDFPQPADRIAFPIPEVVHRAEATQGRVVGRDRGLAPL